MLPGNVRQEVITAFLTDVFYKHIFQKFFTSAILAAFVFAASHNLNSIYAYKTEENSVIVKVDAIV